MWGTIWNINEKKKYSISHPDIYPDVAILDGSLTLRLALDISLATVLDALSHSFEAIWNKNTNPTSTHYSIKAIYIILENVEKLKEDLNDLEIRSSLFKASNIAGLAFSNTQTAAAHSISYPLTAHFGIPHGIASSIPLIPLLDINASKIEKTLTSILGRLEINNLEDLKERIKKAYYPELKYTLSGWELKANELDWLVEKSFTNGLMENNIVDLSKKDVSQILKSIF